MRDRYFLIGYYAQNDYKYFHGNIWFKHESFPSCSWIKEKIANKHIMIEADRVIITSIFEFKDIHDFEAFKS